METININHLRKEYKDIVAVDDLCLTIHEGEIFALLGVNGAGKTTTIKLLSCLTKPTSGDAFIYGHSIVEHPYDVKKMIDISMQETAIARNLTVKENLEFYTKIRCLPKTLAQERIDEIILHFDFTKVLSKRAKTLSGGWQRKLSIALAILSKPKVLFLDEPTLGLDVIARRELWKLIESLKQTMTIILTTHYMEEAEHLSSRIGIMKDGKLVAINTVEEMIQKTSSKTFEDAFISIIEKEGY
jgi:ABC-2 type transport system ATP-binding protein